MKRMCKGIEYENKKGVIVPSEAYKIDKNGSIRVRGGRNRLTKGQRQNKTLVINKTSNVGPTIIER
jgi:hypothetical protein